MSLGGLWGPVGTGFPVAPPRGVTQKTLFLTLRSSVLLWHIVGSDMIFASVELLSEQHHSSRLSTYAPRHCRALPVFARIRADKGGSVLLWPNVESGMLFHCRTISSGSRSCMAYFYRGDDIFEHLWGPLHDIFASGPSGAIVWG